MPETIEITVSVTQEDIANGQRGKCMACPIALAVTRATGARDVHASLAYISGTFPGGIERTAETPDEAMIFMDEFDFGKPVSPFTMTLTFTP